MTLLTAERLGVRRPAYQSGPRARKSKGEDVVDLAGLAGLVLDGWQQDVVEAALGVRSDGRWASFDVGLIVPRQNGKGSILEALELHALYRDPDCRLIMHSAHEFKTANEAFLRILALINANPKLRARATPRFTTGEQGIELDDGSRLKFVARSTGAGRGFSGDLVILDEAYNLSSKMVAAMLPTMSARPNPQLWYTSSAPLPFAYSDVLRRLCKRGRAGNADRLTYFEWCAPKDSAIDDREAWALANPGLNIRVSEEFIAEVELDLLESEDFARERLGVWAEDDKSHGVISAAAWAACVDKKSGPLGPMSFALDVSKDRDWASIVVAGISGRGGVHVEITGDDEVFDHRPGTDWLAGRALELQAKWGGKFAIAKGSPAWSLQIELLDAGVDLEPVSTEEHAQACGDLFDAISDKRLRHLDQPELNAAVAGADRRYYGDAWLWSRRASTVDISPLVAVTLARALFLRTFGDNYDVLKSVL